MVGGGLVGVLAEELDGGRGWAEGVGWGELDVVEEEDLNVVDWVRGR